MKAVVCRSPGELALEDRATPGAPPPGWARVAVSHVGICGTDYHIFEGKHPFLAYPRVMGHEVSGTVVERGEGVDLAGGQPVIINPYLSCGKCIACRHGKPNCCVKIEVLGVHRDGAMCDEILVPAQNLYPTNGLSLADAAAVEFLAIGAHAVRRSFGTPGARTLVIGAGPIGLGTAIFARIAGLDVSLLDMSSERLGFAEKELGFAPLDTSKASAAELVRQPMPWRCRAGQSDITFSDPEFHKREMTLVGSRNALKADFEHVAASIRDGAVPLSKLVTHRTTLAGTPRDLAKWTHEKSGLIKA
ncbi:MAG: zinc-binding alcohol dehydrogenase family protein, partial [Mesorhizobium sp.]